MLHAFIFSLFCLLALNIGSYFLCSLSPTSPGLRFLKRVWLCIAESLCIQFSASSETVIAHLERLGTKFQK